MNAPANINHAAPCSIELEQEVLGAALITNAAFEVIERTVSASDFSEPLHSQLFETFASVHDSHGLITPALVIASMGSDASEMVLEGLTIGQYIARLAAAASLPRNAVAYAKQIREFSNRRKILAMAETMSIGIKGNQSAADIAGAGIELLDEIAAQASAGNTPQVSIRDADDEALTIMQHRMNNPGLAGISSGLKSLDGKTGGLKRGDLLVLAGRPAMGKSAVGICISNAAARAGEPTLFFSLEMSAPSLASRGMADVAYEKGRPIPYFSIDNGQLSDVEAERIIEAGRLRREWPLKIDPTPGLTVSQIAARARKHSQALERQGKRLGLIVVDHLHLVMPSGRYSGNRVHEITEISGALKRLAKELDVPVLVLAQLNRQVENRDNRRPTMADLRDSGSIEQDADAIFFVFREAYYLEREPDAPPEQLREAQHKLEVIIAKQRGGPTGTVDLFCNIKCNAVRDEE
jgi:replicative DNA helicase